MLNADQLFSTIVTPEPTGHIAGGMSDNDVFVTALADAIGRPVEISPILEATIPELSGISF
jgi:sugar (pentulose or hexulose) kinase